VKVFPSLNAPPVCAIMTGFKRSLKYSLVLLPRMLPSWLTKISFWPLMDLAKAEFSAKTLNCLPGYFVDLALDSNLNLTYRRHSRKITFWTFSPSGLRTFTPQMQRNSSLFCSQALQADFNDQIAFLP